ncbi:MAG: YceI family protein [Verrucomicrobiota bacterium]|nr:YceI family protein [Verrucomicrobiota bacterium]|tara:strand:- start:1180 stop:1758 length:579 start_codon:yes stop_codon:yes gene_type:complete
MKTLIPILLLALALPASADVYKAKFGSKLRLDGDSSVHKWKAESRLIGGSFTIDPAALAKPGTITAKAEVKIPVRQIKSGKKKMDEVMHGEKCFDVKKYPMIIFALNGLEVKQARGSLSLCQAKGSITIHGVKKPLTMPVTIARAGSKLTVKGVTTLKMSDFKIVPPAPQLPTGKIVTKNEVKVTFEWVTGK